MYSVLHTLFIFSSQSLQRSLFGPAFEKTSFTRVFVKEDINMPLNDWPISLTRTVHYLQDRIAGGNIVKWIRSLLKILFYTVIIQDRWMFDKMGNDKLLYSSMEHGSEWREPVPENWKIFNHDLGFKRFSSWLSAVGYIIKPILFILA